MYHDVLIVGAGFAGITMAERVASLGKTCLVLEKRDHIGGNAYDYYDDAGVLTHKYGSHLFHTNSDRVFDYLSRFTEWIPARYTATSFTEGKHYSFPLSLVTFEQFLGRDSSTEEMEAWLNEHKVPIDNPKNSEEVIISQVGWELYEKFYKGYVLKQWQRHPRDLDASVLARQNIRTTRNELYFDDKYQFMPKHGYTAMFQKMLDHKNITVMLNKDYHEFIAPADWTVYTGAIDEYYRYYYGALPYRTLRFEPEHFQVEFKNPTFMVAYPNSEEHTREIEIKHVTGQQCNNTTVVKEYAEEWTLGKERLYPVPTPASAELYAKYKLLADAQERTTFVGRLATYKYYNMDQVVGATLAAFERIKDKL